MCYDYENQILWLYQQPLPNQPLKPTLVFEPIFDPSTLDQPWTLLEPPWNTSWTHLGHILDLPWLPQLHHGVPQQPLNPMLEDPRTLSLETWTQIWRLNPGSSLQLLGLESFERGRILGTGSLVPVY